MNFSITEIEPSYGKFSPLGAYEVLHIYDYEGQTAFLVADDDDELCWVPQKECKYYRKKT